MHPSLCRSQQKWFVEHLNGLLIFFSNYFDNLDFAKFAWIQNPFIDEEDDDLD